MSFDITNPTKYSCEPYDDKTKEMVRKLLDLGDANINLNYNEQYKKENKEEPGWHFDETNVAKVDADCKFKFISPHQIPLIDEYYSNYEEPRRFFEKEQYLDFSVGYQLYTAFENGLEFIKYLSKI